MTSKGDKGTPNMLVDEFDAYAQVFRQLKHSRRLNWVLLGFLLLLLGALVLLVLQPPFVIVKDRTSGETPKVVYPSDRPDITLEDVEKFFVYSVRRRWGWESATIIRDFEELYTLMTEEMRTAFSAYVHQPVEPIPTHGEPQNAKKEKIPRVFNWMQQHVRNHVSINLDAVQCEEGAPVRGVRQWYCRTKGTLETTPMMLKGLPETAAVHKKLEFRGRFQPAKYSMTRLWGLGIAYLDVHDPEQ